MFFQHFNRFSEIFWLPSTISFPVVISSSISIVHCFDEAAMQGADLLIDTAIQIQSAPQ